MVEQGGELHLLIFPCCFPHASQPLGHALPALRRVRTLEDLFHLRVVVPIETTDVLRFFGTLHLSANISVLRTVVGLNAQPTIGPQLPFAAEPVRGLHPRDQAGGSNRADAGNLAQQFRSLMFPALG